MSCPGVPGLCSGLHSITAQAIRAQQNPKPLICIKSFDSSPKTHHQQLKCVEGLINLRGIHNYSQPFTVNIYPATALQSILREGVKPLNRMFVHL
jgi:hypothetical protein